MVGQAAARGDPFPVGGVLRAAVLRPLPRVPPRTRVSHRPVGDPASVARNGVVHRGRHLRLFRVFGSFDDAIDAVRGYPRRPVLAPDRRAASGRISGGLALPRDVEWRATGRHFKSPALQHLPEPADRYVETTLLPVYNRGDRRRPYRPYMRMHKAVWKLEKKGQREGTRQMRRELQRLPSRDPDDPDYRRLHYVRYADLCRARHKSAYAALRL